MCCVVWAVFLFLIKTISLLSHLQIKLYLLCPPHYFYYLRPHILPTKRSILWSFAIYWNTRHGPVIHALFTETNVWCVILMITFYDQFMMPMMFVGCLNKIVSYSQEYESGFVFFRKIFLAICLNTIVWNLSVFRFKE